MQVTEYHLKNITVQTQVFAVRRLDNSQYGNPHFEFVTDAGTYRTAANSMVAYTISPSRIEGKQALLTLDGNGQITNVEGAW